MKIEKTNENQIRCTLTQTDLADRHLKLSELAYGTEKAKILFQDMMQQANFELGFEAEDIPLMIEAIPLSPEAIILIITKVEYPEELDTRFSKFSDMPERYDDYVNENREEMFAESADDILGLFRKIKEDKSKNKEDFVPLKDMVSSNTHTAASSQDVNVPVDLTKLFVFHNLSDIIRLSHILKDFYNGENSLFKDMDKSLYYLILHKSSHTPEVFNKVCNILAEYANQGVIASGTEAYFMEHHQLLCGDCALQTFAAL